MEIKGDYDSFNTNYRGESKLCSLVDTIYNNSNDVSASLVESITGKYGNCFTDTVESKNGSENDFIRLCRESCHIQENKLKICNKLSSPGVTSCTEYMNDNKDNLYPIHIQKNGLYYNCSPEYKQVGEELQYIETPCIPKNNICTEDNIGFKKECKHHNFTDNKKKCEDYHMSYPGGEYYNCISNYLTESNGDEPQNSCVKNIDNVNKPCYKKNYFNYGDFCKQKYQ